MLRLFTAVIALVGLAGTSRAEEPRPGKQVEMEFKAGEKSVGYFLYLPKDYGSKEKWPLLFFLHGRGESQPPLSTVKKWGPPRLIERGENFHYIVVSPQCPMKESWAQPGQQELLLKLLEDLCEKQKVDKDKIYLSGLSMGGYGSWRLAADHPDKFAAVIPICGAGKPEDAEKLKSLPIWAWHGTEDTAVPFQRSVEMVEAIKKAGGTKVKFTSLEGIGHNSWEAAYATPEIFQWLDKQSASKNK